MTLWIPRQPVGHADQEEALVEEVAEGVSLAELQEAGKPSETQESPKASAGWSQCRKLDPSHGL